MQAKRQAKDLEMAQPRPAFRPPDLVIVSLSVKEANQDQFQTGLRLALDEVRKGTKMSRIVELLNKRGLKTRTGREWKYAILRNELQALKNAHVPPQGSGQSVGKSP
jgi:hypothetical protein